MNKKIDRKDLEFEGICYVVVRLSKKAHPIADFRHDLIWYPEDGMTLLNRVSYVPYVQSIVTEDPWIIACYPQERVRVWGKSRVRYRFVEASDQTYGASVGSITSSELGIRQTIPAMPLDGGSEIRKLERKLLASY
jgi:hypothetical protein